jgi:acid phosphatase (class A)
MLNRFTCLALAVLVAASTNAGAQTPSPPVPASPPKTLMVLTPYDIDAHRLLPAPPADGGEANRAELAELHRIIAARTPERLAQAKWDDDHEDPSLFYATIGGGFDLKSLPATAALLAIAMNDETLASSAAKKTFARKRPWVLDPSIPTCDPDDKPLTSYPSGHALVGYTAGVILASLIPEKAEAIQARAADYAFSREVCGAHYASDAEASHVLGAVIATELLDNPGLQPKIEAARAELRAAHFTAR